MDNTAASAPSPVIGIVGIGAMGFAMAKNLHRRGHALVVRDVREEAHDEARAEGIATAHSARALAEAVALAVVVVVDAAQIDAVLFGPDGVVRAERRPHAVMLCSTIAPEDTERFGAGLAAHGIATLDAPISGGPARAEAGTMSMMLAGAADVLHRWEPVLADLAARRFMVGPRLGDAAKAKLVNNLLAGTNLVAGAEALAFGTRLGLDPRQLFDLIRASSGASWAFEDRMARALDGDFAPRAAVPILTKDMTLATRLAASVDQPTPVGAAALERLREAVARGWGALDDAAVIKTYER